MFSDGITIALGLVLLVISQRMATGPADSDFRPADSDLKNPQKRAKRRDSYRAVGLFLIGVGLVKIFYFAPAGVGDSSSHKWRAVTTTDGALSVRMPGKPTFQSEVQQGVSGKSRFVSQIVDVFDGAVTCSIKERHYLDADLPPEPSQLLKIAAQATLAQSKGKLLDEREIHCADVPGREITISMPNRYIVVTQFYQLGQCVYQLTVVTPDSMAGLPIVREFLDSLVFVKRAG